MKASLALGDRSLLRVEGSRDDNGDPEVDRVLFTAFGSSLPVDITVLTTESVDFDDYCKRLLVRYGT